MSANRLFNIIEATDPMESTHFYKVLGRAGTASAFIQAPEVFIFSNKLYTDKYNFLLWFESEEKAALKNQLRQLPEGVYMILCRGVFHPSQMVFETHELTFQRY